MVLENKSNQKLWYLQDLVDKLDGTYQGRENINININRVIIDSRIALAGDLFFAIKGDRLDGHEFVNNAFKTGASLAIVSKDYQHRSKDNNYIIVDDTFLALKKLAIASRKRNRGVIIAVTGSVGKTTTKDILYSCISSYANTHASPKSFNNKWGVALALANMPINSDVGIFELGMNNIGEISDLTSLVRPNISIITNVENAHIGNLKTIMNIGKAKSEIMDSMNEGCYVILNRDSNCYKLLEKKANKKKLNIVTFGEAIKSDIQLLELNFLDNVISTVVKVFDKKYRYKLNTNNKFLAYNSLPILAIFKILKLNLQSTFSNINFNSVSKSRWETIKFKISNGSFTLIDDSYNASPMSMNSSVSQFDSLKIPSNGRKIAVLGDMLDLGEYEFSYHSDLIKQVSESNIDIVYTCGESMHKHLNKIANNIKIHWSLDSQEVSKLLLNNICEDDVILVKGSNAMKMNIITQDFINNYELF
ncbi:MAG: UDP-N-acetylmuramoyl-tripeptide--D-alanyl-D-alanine ligase [Alphaproteobacteria bacterium]|jgi:UDP-N-acetylmuramoyl-tripeptide--D-alanyl-D-alanine ligase|tara:strand:- start:40337 stop:41767 length:1431 start_codon:yes stop_codon:yes gene_type:complete